MFCLRVGRQVVAPGFGRKGNLLTSLFLLFTGLVERVIGLARELVLRAPQGVCGSFYGREWVGRAWVFSRRHLRWGMLVAAWILFILSSWEWAVARSPAAETIVAERQIERVGRAERVEIEAVADLQGASGHWERSGLPGATLDGPAIDGRRWLRLRVLRI